MAAASLDSPVVVADSSASSAALGTSQLFSSAPVVIVADSDSWEAASYGAVLGVPVLLTGGAAELPAEVADELKRLGTRTVLANGVPAQLFEKDLDVHELAAAAPALASDLGLQLEYSAEPADTDAAIEGLGSKIYGSPAQAPLDSEEFTFSYLPAQRLSAAVVVTDAAHRAALGTAVAAGASVQLSPADPRSSSAVIEAVAGADGVVGLFAEDNPDLSWQLATAHTGIQLPGGGQRVFDGKRYVALYGSPHTTTLGVLGEQGVAETVARAEQHAQPYREFTDDQVIPALEIIVTVAAGGPGDDGNYSNEWAPESFIPLIEAAQEAGQYVVIDLQPGRADFVSQAKAYEQLLAYPHVGLALDPEWRLGPNDMPLTRIGHVEIAEVNEVVNYLADFTREHNLPQKMLILHQFQVQMLRDIDQLDQSRSELAILIHVDGQGSQAAKQDTWRTLVNNAPNVTRWGWKNFYDEDVPMLDPAGTYQVEPLPDFVSYQ
ncbi:hypothetical protein [Trueperella bialowiezensis]|uniref:hypothetical protein n=1 Tax=Trueperella bialowiezensis TaxID=312285 RepID=UPI0018D564A9|nr:hypothetical protein [Trueperella bialowiezensis]